MTRSLKKRERLRKRRTLKTSLRYLPELSELVQVAWNEMEIYDEETGEVEVVKRDISGNEYEFHESVFQAVSKSELHEAT